MDEGYIKFRCNLIEDETPNADEIEKLNFWRNQLFAKNLIGMYPNGIGFGNISERHSKYPFIISGTATGEHPVLKASQYTFVTEFNFETNSLTCKGSVKASSESLSHAIVYQTLPWCKAVIHVHHLPMWKALLHKAPTTNENVAYGTPEMAYELERLLQNNSTITNRIIIMGGHEEGILTFGEDLDSAGKTLLHYFSHNRSVDFEI